MKIAIVIAFACCCALALAEDKRCKSGNDCGEDECCMKRSTAISGKCKKLRQKDEFCFPRNNWNEKDNTYNFSCPCVAGLDCKGLKIEEKNGVNSFKHAKCVEQ